jgi:hypothetical protein
MTTVSDVSSTSWLEAHTETVSNLRARPAAMAPFRGDNWMVWCGPHPELRPVTMALAIAPVPTNPRVIDYALHCPRGLQSEVRRTLAGLRIAGTMWTPANRGGQARIHNRAARTCESRYSAATGTAPPGSLRRKRCPEIAGNSARAVIASRRVSANGVTPNQVANVRIRVNLQQH